MEKKMSVVSQVDYVGELEEEPPRSKTRKCLRLFATFLVSHVGLTALLLAYTVGGALLFIAVEQGKWLAQQNSETDIEHPVMPEPDYALGVTIAVKQWKASWMDDKVLRFWNHTHQVNEIYPEDWSRDNHEKIQLWEVELNDFIIGEIVARAKAYAANVTAREEKLKANKINAPNWEFSSAFLYALSITTTIGYGHVAPCTLPGKFMTIGYAIIGVPIMLAFLGNVGGLMAKGLRILFDHLFLMKCCRNWHKRRRARKQSQAVSVSGPPSVAGGSSPMPVRVQKQSLIMNEGGSQAGVRSLKAYGYPPDELFPIVVTEKKEDQSVPVLMCVVIMGLYLFLGALIFSIWEKWEFWDGLYFCFITLSTIGLGDFVPGKTLTNLQGGSHLQPIACCFYILLGLALLASCFNLLHDSARHSIRVVGKKIGLVKRKQPQPNSRRASQAQIV